MTNQPTDQPLTIDQAAERLGISREAVRLRLRRGTLAGEHRPVGWLIYLVGRSQTVADRPDDQSSARQSEVEYLRAALEREQLASSVPSSRPA